MKNFLILLFTVITIFGFLNILLILGSSHSFSSVDLTYRIVAMVSLILFPATGIYTYKELVTGPRQTDSDAVVTMIFLVLTTLIFGYYSIEMFTDEYSDSLSFYHVFPGIILLALVV